MEENAKDIFQGYPIRIENAIVMTNVNEPIEIYKGEYLLNFNGESLKVDGAICFLWHPDSGAYFTGTPCVDKYHASRKIIENKSYDIIVNDLKFGEGFITNFSIGFEGDTFIKGVISGHALTGDGTIPVEKISFVVPNLRSFLGAWVKTLNEGDYGGSKARLIFENDDYLINIDKINSFNDKRKLLSEKGGSIILYNGALLSKTTTITFEQSKDIFYAFGTFLHFLNGSRTSALFLQGLYNDEVVWCDYTDYSVDSYQRSSMSWVPSNKHLHEDINKSWQKFSSLWKNLDNKQFLSSAIRWYIESNNSSSFHESGIIMAQTALELIYNWWIVEQKRFIVGRDSENISAANKIRLVLSQIQQSSEVPNSLNELQQFLLDDKIKPADAPEAIVQIRNAIVHSQQEKRKKISEISYKVKYQALQVYIWYIELALLKIFEYDNVYNNRTKSFFPDIVPWSAKKII